MTTSVRPSACRAHMSLVRKLPNTGKRMKRFWLDFHHVQGWNCRAVGVEPQFMSTGAHFWVKIGLKLQSLGKISKISAADPRVLLGQFQHWPCIVKRYFYATIFEFFQKSQLTISKKMHFLMLVFCE